MGNAIFWQPDEALDALSRSPDWLRFLRLCREAGVHFAIERPQGRTRQVPPVYAARTLRLEKVSAERWREVPIAQGQPAATPQAAVADAFERTRTTDMALDAAWLELLGEPAAVVVEPAPAAPALDTMIADLLGDPVAELIG